MPEAEQDVNPVFSIPQTTTVVVKLASVRAICQNIKNIFVSCFDEFGQGTFDRFSNIRDVLSINVKGSWQSNGPASKVVRLVTSDHRHQESIDWD